MNGNISPKDFQDQMMSLLHSIIHFPEEEQSEVIHNLSVIILNVMVTTLNDMVSFQFLSC